MTDIEDLRRKYTPKDLLEKRFHFLRDQLPPSISDREIHTIATEKVPTTFEEATQRMELIRADFIQAVDLHLQSLEEGLKETKPDRRKIYYNGVRRYRRVEQKRQKVIQAFRTALGIVDDEQNGASSTGVSEERLAGRTTDHLPVTQNAPILPAFIQKRPSIFGGIDNILNGINEKADAGRETPVKPKSTKGQHRKRNLLGPLVDRDEPR